MLRNLFQGQNFPKPDKKTELQPDLKSFTDNMDTRFIPWACFASPRRRFLINTVSKTGRIICSDSDPCG